MKKAIINASIAAYVGVVGMLMFGANANAYIDPSVMTYLIQAVAAVVVTVGAAIGILWAQAKKKINDKLGIDENSKKEIEDDDIVVK